MTETLQSRYAVRYSQPLARTDPIRGTLTITADEVVLATKVPLGSPQVGQFLYLGSVVVCVGLLPLYLFFTGPINPSLDFKLMMLLYCCCMGSMILGIVLAVLPLRRKWERLRRDDLLKVETHGRELHLQAGELDLVVTAQTIADAEALAAALRERSDPPVIRPIRLGQEALFDTSGFSHLKTVQVMVQDGMVSLAGKLLPGKWQGWGSFAVLVGSIALGIGLVNLPPPVLHRVLPAAFPVDLIPVVLFCVGGIGCFAVLMITKTESRAFPCADVQAVDVIHRFVTFLASDVPGGERRYTLQMATPEEAARLAQCLTGNRHASLQTECRPALGGKNDQDAALYLSRSEIGRPQHPGAVVVDTETVTFTGRSGLAHPWAWRLAALLMLLGVPLLMPLTGQAAMLRFLDVYDRERAAALITLMLLLVGVYLPATSLLGHLLGARVSAPRRQIIHVVQTGRQLTLTLFNKITSQQISLTVESEAAAEALAGELGRR